MVNYAWYPALTACRLPLCAYRLPPRTYCYKNDLRLPVLPSAKPMNKKTLIIFLTILLSAVLAAAGIYAAVRLSRRTPADPDATPSPSGGDSYLSRLDDFSCVTVTCGADPMTSVNITWQTFRDELSECILEYNTEGDDGKTAAPVSEKTTFQIPMDGQFDYKNPSLREVSGVVHRVYLTDLEPGAEYTYRITSGDVSSDDFSFTTASAGEEFSFLLVSDMQGFTQRDFDVWGSTAALMTGAFPDYDFIVNMGDQVEEGKNQYQWQMLFKAAGSVIPNSTVIDVPGNKDKKYAMLHFTNGAEDDRTALVSGYYSFNRGKVHFAVLNTGDGDKDIPKAQLKWLRRDLEAAAGYHKIILIHKAPYSDANHCNDEEILAIREQVMPVAGEYGVTAVLEGHDHYYFRSIPVTADGAAADHTVSSISLMDRTTKMFKVNGSGTVYFMNGAAGTRQHDKDILPQEDVLSDRSELMTCPSFSYVSVDSEKIVFMTWCNNNGSLKFFDSWGVYF